MRGAPTVASELLHHNYFLHFKLFKQCSFFILDLMICGNKEKKMVYAYATHHLNPSFQV